MVLVVREGPAVPADLAVDPVALADLAVRAVMPARVDRLQVDPEPDLVAPVGPAQAPMADLELALAAVLVVVVDAAVLRRNR